MHKKLMFQTCLMAMLPLAAQAAEPFGHWTFDGYLDDTAGAAHGTFAGGAPTYVPGRLGQAIWLDGVDDAVVVMVENLRAYTMTVWVMPDRTNAAGIVTRTSPSGPTVHWSHQMRIAPTGQFEHYIYDGASKGVVGATPVEAGNWYFIAVSAADNGMLRLYVNGQEEGSPLALGMLWSGGDRFHIGSNSGGDIGWFQGVVDDVRIYDQELTQADLAALIAAAPFPFAFSPQPKNGTMLEQTSIELRWNKGDSAVSHNIYIGEDLDAVAAGTAPMTQTTAASLWVGVAGGPYPDGLVPGRTYYWRVDEVNPNHPDSPWQGQVWSFWLPPLAAWAPSPADGATYVDPDGDLTWQKGMAALFHTAFFGDSFDAVNDATKGAMIPNTTYDPGTLQNDKTYYWRVDEFDNQAQTHRGEVWSFTTRPVIPVTSDPNLRLWWTLDEGAGAAGAADWSGRGRHGTLAGAATWVLDGYFAGALTFNGGGYLYNRSAPAMPSQTVCAWVKTLQAPASILGWANAIPVSGTHDKTLYINADRTASFYIWDGAAKSVTSTQVVADGAWHHIAGVYTTTQTMELYIDGVLQGSTAVGGIFNGYTTPHLTAGIESHARGYLNGAIDDVRIYNKVLSEADIQALIAGDGRLASNPDPAPAAVVDIRDADVLSWTAGSGAASHDVYFGDNVAAAAAADRASPLFRGNRTATTLPLTGLVEFGGGDYCWRVDEVASDGTVRKGQLWTFTVPAYLVVEDFERYANASPLRVFQAWVDGVGFSRDEFFPNDNPGNLTGAALGHDIWTTESPHFDGQIMERAIVHGGAQAAPLYYSGLSQIDRTFSPAQNWTAQGVTTLVVHFRGVRDNGGQLYLKVNGAKVAYTSDPADIESTRWVAWPVEPASLGVDLTKITTLSIGVEGGQTGLLYLDDIRLTRP
jgi:hypothetical protein